MLNIIETKVQISNVQKHQIHKIYIFKVFAASSVKVALKCQFPQKYEHSSNHNPTVTKHHSKELHGMTSSCQEP
jgi:hypothetical protein